MKCFWLGICCLTLLSSCSKSNGSDPVTPPVSPAPTALNTDFIRGADLSFTPEILLAGTSFKDNSQTKDLVQIFKDKGINTVRLRLWHSPVDGHSSLQEVLDFAKTLNAKGFNIWLDIHYSDTWADPGNQTKPNAWKNASLTTLKDSIYQYTSSTVQAFKNAGITLKLVQIGNETNSGFLWDLGKVGGSFDTNWSNYALLVKEAIRAVKDVSSTTKTMLHYAGFDTADWFFSNVAAQNISYDYIGLSYYPVWHGKSLDALQTALTSLVNKYQKPIIIAETSYPFTLSWNDYTNNVVGTTSQLIPAYDATPEGQNAYLKALFEVMRKIPGQQGLGICWWAPEWVSFKGPTATNGSNAENLTLFDFSNNALPALTSLGSYQ
ncbi:MAG: glycosyl hydrolase 53 family protein [Bacteroidota bacterium]